MGLSNRYLEVLKQSVIKLIDSHDYHIKIHAAHGPSSTILDEKLHNYFYLTWKEEQTQV